VEGSRLRRWRGGIQQAVPVPSTIAVLLWIVGLVIAIVGGVKFGVNVAETLKVHAEQQRKWAFSEILQFVLGFGTLL